MNLQNRPLIMEIVPNGDNIHVHTSDKIVHIYTKEDWEERNKFFKSLIIKL